MVLGTVAPQALRVAAVARNKAPIAIIDTYQSTEDTALSVTGPGVLGNDFDLNGDALSAQLDTDAKHGIVTLAADGSFTYTPAAQYSGRDSFYYTVSDGVATKRGKVLINIAAVNDVPGSGTRCLFDGQEHQTDGQEVHRCAGQRHRPRRTHKAGATGVGPSPRSVGAQTQRLIHLHPRRRLQRRR